MIKSRNFVVLLGLGLTSLVTATGCSTSAFTGGTSGSKSSAATSANTADSSASAAPAKSTTASSPANAGTSTATNTSSGGTAFATSFAAVSPTDAAVAGCSLPANVAASMKAFVAPVSGQTSLALDGSSWSGATAQSALGLVNLDLNSCEWFQALKGSNVPHYMVLFTNAAKTQSYAQPFSLSANAITYAACISSAAVASGSVDGAIACDYVPSN